MRFVSNEILEIAIRSFLKYCLCKTNYDFFLSETEKVWVFLTFGEKKFEKKYLSIYTYKAQRN